MLSTLSPGKHKLYVLGHGSPAGDDISADLSGNAGSLNVRKIVDLLAAEGLSKEFDDIRFNACFGADTVEPESFNSEVLNKSAGLNNRNWLPKFVSKKPFAQKVSDELFKRGFAGIVKAYHGLGDIYSLEGTHTRRIAQKVSDELFKRGFAGIVKAYHGLGDIYSLEGTHTRRIKMINAADRLTRGKTVRRTFSPM
ncbi:hypothetical protein P349_04943 [Enterobacter sp. DC4]|nr:hypothetical protein P349_04943 [Enterobacter sp. DC4]